MSSITLDSYQRHHRLDDQHYPNLGLLMLSMMTSSQGSQNAFHEIVQGIVYNTQQNTANARLNIFLILYLFVCSISDVNTKLTLHKRYT
jgi:hypothetical protein